MRRQPCAPEGSADSASIADKLKNCRFVGFAPKKDAVVVLVGVGVTEGVSRNVVPDTAVGSIPAAVGLGVGGCHCTWPAHVEGGAPG